MRAQVELSQLVREVEFTELVKRRLIEQIKDEVESVRKIEREAEAIERQMNPKGKKPPKLKDEDKKNMQPPDQGAARGGQSAHRRARAEHRAPARDARHDLPR
jgi:hypothetical protein